MLKLQADAAVFQRNLGMVAKPRAASERRKKTVRLDHIRSLSHHITEDEERVKGEVALLGSMFHLNNDDGAHRVLGFDLLLGQHQRLCVFALLCVAVSSLAAQPRGTWPRRQVVAGALGAEAAWRQLIAGASAADVSDMLPPGVVEQIEAGRIVTIPNWLPAAEVRALRADAAPARAAAAAAAAAV